MSCCGNKADMPRRQRRFWAIEICQLLLRSFPLWDFCSSSVCLKSSIETILDKVPSDTKSGLGWSPFLYWFCQIHILLFVWKPSKRVPPLCAFTARLMYLATLAILSSGNCKCCYVPVPQQGRVDSYYIPLLSLSFFLSLCSISPTHTHIVNSFFLSLCSILPTHTYRIFFLSLFFTDNGCGYSRLSNYLKYAFTQINRNNVSWL